MSNGNNNGLQKVQVREHSPLAHAAATPPGQWQVYRAVHGTLRGRYWLAAILAIIGGAGGWIAGAALNEPLYRSEGLVRIAYNLPVVVQETDQNQPMGMFDEFLRSQQLLMSSRAVLDAALQKPAWQATGRPSSPMMVGRFVKSLLVEHPGNTQDLRVSFTDADPTAAAAAVRSIIETYQDFYVREVQRPQAQRLAALEDRRKNLEQQLQSLRGAIDGIAAEIGTTEVDRLYDAAVLEVIKLQSKLNDAKLAEAMLRRDPGLPGDAPPVPPADVMAVAEQLATANPVLRDEIAQKQRIEQELQEARLRGCMDDHPTVVRLRRLLEIAEERIRDSVQTRQRVAATVAMTPPTALAAGMVVPDVHGITMICDDATKKMFNLGTRRNRLQELKQDETAVRAEFDQTTRRLSVLQTEATIGNRLSIISFGEVPLSPFKDQYDLFTMGGALIGAGAGVGLLVLTGLARPRYRYSDEAGVGLLKDIPLLGIVPWLPHRLRSAEQASQAAQCVHIIRAKLQVGTGGARTLLVTSSTASEGKTSMAASLGLSFAASGSRTLLIDCDLVGQRLTRGFKLTGQRGVRDVLKQSDFRTCTWRVNNSLSVVPTGRVDATGGSTLSPAVVQRLIEEARKDFDVVLIDTGPILGSVEAMVAAPEVDGVVLVVSRGQRQPAVERAIAQLRAIHAKIAGVVFNRSGLHDLHQSVQTSSIADGTQRPNLNEQEEGGADFGPIFQSVASFLPGSNGKPRFIAAS